MNRKFSLVLLALSLVLLPCGAEGKSKKTSDKELIAAKQTKADEEKSKDKDSAKSEKSEKSEKASKSEKSSDKKSTDAKSEDKKDDKKAEKKTDEPKKSGGSGGLFGLGGGSKDNKKKPTAKATQSTQPKAPEDPNAPKFKNDPALISVLKDVSKSLKDSEAVKSLEGAQDKLIAKLVSDTLEKSLAASGGNFNRILAEADRSKMQKSMSAESWESGDVEVSPELKASVVALWAKRIDGLLTVSVVGDYNGNVEGAEGRLGEFVAVITARSTVDKGFDIQSQAEVTYWLAKVEGIKIDRGNRAAADEQKSELNIHAPITGRKREFLIAMANYEHDKHLLALKIEDDKRKKEEEAKAKSLSETQQKALSEALAKSVAEALSKTNPTGAPPEKKSESAADVTGAENTSTNKAELTEQQTASQAAVAQPAQQQLGQSPPADSVPASTPGAGDRTSVAMMPEPARTSRSAWESPGSTVPVRSPSVNATVIYPARALAGHFLTVAVQGTNRNPEQYVALSFNGAALSTGENGKVIYQVPEDAPPGYSLNVGLPARPGDPSSAINILQPLSVPSSPQIPKIDQISPVVSNKGVITIEGHSFDGIAERNRIIIDGQIEANVIAASPVQLVVEVPPGLAAGAHNLSISTTGLKSNQAAFDVVTVDLQPLGDASKNEVKKLVVKVVGTQNRVRVKLSNQTRDVIKLVRGDELVVVTSGGPMNSTTVPVQRLRSGNYKIDAEILI